MLAMSDAEREKEREESREIYINSGYTFVIDIPAHSITTRNRHGSYLEGRVAGQAKGHPSLALNE